MHQLPDDRLESTIVARGHRIEAACAVFVLAVAAWFYFWTATSGANPYSTKLQPDDLYNRLADSFLAGKVSLLEIPDPKLVALDDPWDPAQNAGLSPFHDVSYYKGRFYLYFGAAPAVLLLAPWKVLTGTYLGENLAAVIFALIGTAAGLVLVAIIRRRHFPGVSPWMSGLCFVGVAFGNFLPLLLRRPIFYELAIASAHAFAMGSLVCVAFATEGSARKRLWLVLSGVFFGLTLGSRPNYLFGAVVLCIPFLSDWRAWRSKSLVDTRRLINDAAAVAIPLGLILGVLLAYNYARFGQLGEFGQDYVLSGINPHKDVHTTFAFLPTNFWFYFMAPTQWSAFFPFFQVIHMPWFQFPEGYTGEEDVYGILNVPFYWATFVMVWIRKDRVIPNVGWLKDLATGMLALSLLNFLVLSRIGGASNRYMVDIFPLLLPLAAAGVFWLESTAKGALRRACVRTICVAAIAYSALFNVLVSIQHNDLFQYYQPAAYGRMAHASNWLSFWAGETAPEKRGPLRIRLKLPTERVGHLEPLVVTGVSFKADFIYLFYAGENHLQVGFEHTSYGGPKTEPPLEIDYSTDHVFEIEMGSLYPPRDHPFFDGMLPAEVDKLKRTFSVTIDGHRVLSGTYDFYDSSPGDVTVGKNTVSDAFGRHFTGEILEVSRVAEMRRAP